MDTSHAPVVVVLPPAIDHDPRLGQAGELLDLQQLVADARVELSTYGFCHGEPGSMDAVLVPENQHRSHTACLCRFI